MFFALKKKKKKTKDWEIIHKQSLLHEDSDRDVVHVDTTNINSPWAAPVQSRASLDDFASSPVRASLSPSRGSRSSRSHQRSQQTSLDDYATDDFPTHTVDFGGGKQRKW